MPERQFEISAALGELNDLAPAGYALGIHIEYTTPKFMFQTYPKPWLDYYSSNGLVMSDPMVGWGFQNVGSKRWSELDDPAGVMKSAADFGMPYGVVIAMALEDKTSICGFAKADAEFTDSEIAALQDTVSRVVEHTAETAQLDDETVAQLKKMSIMVTHPGG